MYVCGDLRNGLDESSDESERFDEKKKNVEPNAGACYYSKLPYWWLAALLCYVNLWRFDK
jgi:hypothetical protein